MSAEQPIQPPDPFEGNDAYWARTNLTQEQRDALANADKNLNGTLAQAPRQDPNHNNAFTFRSGAAEVLAAQWAAEDDALAARHAARMARFAAAIELSTVSYMTDLGPVYGPQPPMPSHLQPE